MGWGGGAAHLALCRGRGGGRGDRRDGGRTLARHGSGGLELLKRSGLAVNGLAVGVLLKMRMMGCGVMRDKTGLSHAALGLGRVRSECTRMVVDKAWLPRWC